MRSKGSGDTHRGSVGGRNAMASNEAGLGFRVLCTLSAACVCVCVMIDYGSFIRLLYLFGVSVVMPLQRPISFQ